VVLAQLAEQLFEVGQRNLMTLTDGRERDGTSIFAQGDIDHGRDGKTTFSAQTHGEILSAYETLHIYELTNIVSNLQGQMRMP
jgi:hypothetical protein